MASRDNRATGIGLPTTLAIVFAVLKLCGVIAWPWWWVLNPLWITLGVVFILLVAAAVLEAIR